MKKVFETPNRQDDHSGDSEEIPVPPDDHPPAPIVDPPFDPDQAPIDEGPKGPKQIV
jgi:hypothetical protein